MKSKRVVLAPPDTRTEPEVHLDGLRYLENLRRRLDELSRTATDIAVSIPLEIIAFKTNLEMVVAHVHDTQRLCDQAIQRILVVVAEERLAQGDKDENTPLPAAPA